MAFKPFQLFRKASAALRAMTFSTGSYSARWTKDDYESLAREGYMRNVYVFRAVNMIANGCAGIPWKAYRKRGKDKVEIEEGQSGYELLQLIQRPNPNEGQAAFFQSFVGHLQTQGNAFIERVGPDNKPPRELYSHRPDRIRIVYGNRFQPIDRYEYTEAGEPVKFEPDNKGKFSLLHLRFWHPLNPWFGEGFAPTRAAANSIDQNNASREWNVGLLQNGAKPSGVYTVHPDVTLDDEQKKDLRAQLKEIYTGRQNAGKPFIADGLAGWTPTALSPSDMDWLNGIRLSALEVALAFNVPPGLLGDPDSKTYANRREDRRSLYNETILPLMDYIRDEFNNWLTPLFGDDLYLAYDKNEIEALQEDQNEVYTRVKGAEHLTINEKREMTGQDSLDGGDVLEIPNTVQVVSSEEADIPGVLEARKPSLPLTDQIDKTKAGRE